jgi:hypothetical protein
MIVKFWEVTPSAGKLAVVGVMVMEEMVSAAVAVVVPVIVPEAAVIVVVPAEMPVSKPPVVMVATVGSELDQQTTLPVQVVPPVSVLVLPSLNVAAATSCSGVEFGPNATVGLGGSMVMVETVGFWKNPLQLTARTNVANAAKATARRTFCFMDDMVN